VFHETPPAGPLNEREAIYRALAGDDPFDAADSADGRERAGRDDAGHAGPTAFACLGCGAVTTADDRPDSCPACHRTPGDRRDGALFQRLE